MPEASLNDRVIQLEELVSHQDHLLQQLNRVIVQLQAEHNELRSAMQRHVDRLESRIESQTDRMDPNEKPPHY